MSDERKNSGNQNSDDWNSGDCNSGSWNSGNWNSGDLNSGDWNSGSCNSGDCNSGNCNSGNWNSGDLNSGSCNSGDCNSGNCNSGSWNSGFFNSTEPTLRLFNKNTDLKASEFRLCNDFSNFNLTLWIPENKMTDQEKRDNPKFFVTKGYLRTIRYKDAWRNFWNTLSEDDKNKIKTLPNFDAVVFFEITGIDVKVDLSAMKSDLISRADKLFKEGQDLLNQARGIRD